MKHTSGLFPETVPSPTDADPKLERVATWLQRQPNFTLRIAGVIQRAVDYLVDGPNTGRISIEELDKNEKIYIAVKIEHYLLAEFTLEKRGPLDTWIEEVPVDVKSTIGRNWMIPTEAVGEICVLLRLQEMPPLFSLGLLRVSDDLLLRGQNKDSKRGLAQAAVNHIRWLAREEPWPQNPLLRIPIADRKAILGAPSGQERINELLYRVQRTPLSTAVIDTVARQRDSSKRVRDARAHYSAELEIVHGKSPLNKQLGLGLRNDEWMSLRREEIAPPEGENHNGDPDQDQ